jgi:hypothetical protein
MGGAAASWSLSVVFGATGAWSIADLGRALRGRLPWRGDRAAGAGLHVLMSAGMVSMLWPWGAAVPPIALIVAFTGAAAWFAGRALFTPVPAAALAGGSGWGARGGVPPDCARQGPRNWYHAAMMAAMVWMAVALSVPATLPSGAVAAMAADASMPGMAMGAAAPGGAAGGPADWVSVVCVVAGLAFVAAAAWYGFALLRRLGNVAPGAPGRRRALLDDTAGAAAAAGVAAMLLLMA